MARDTTHSTTTDSTESTAVACTICDRHFDDMDHLTDHLEASHGVLNRAILRHARPVPAEGPAATGDS